MMLRPATIAVAAAMLTACSDGFEQVGYFKDDGNNRIKTFILPPDASPETVAQHAHRQTATAGSLFAAYYYAPGSRVPADGVTLARNLVAATDVIYEGDGLSGWRFAFMRPRAGPELFVDCEATPGDDLCRK
jgi:hypothetical protein